MDNSELKKDRFKRVASRRVDNILKGIRSLSKCSNENNYEYNEEDLTKMVKAIKEELKIMETLYKKNLKSNTESFNF
jgi:DNA-binding transcriptional regulator GbsR (MarR family)